VRVLGDVVRGFPRPTTGRDGDPGLFGPKPDGAAQDHTAERPSGEREMALAEAYASGSDNGIVSTNGHGEFAESAERSDEIRA